jgi:hypothetical protein
LKQSVRRSGKRRLRRLLRSILKNTKGGRVDQRQNGYFQKQMEQLLERRGEEALIGIDIK